MKAMCMQTRFYLFSTIEEKRNFAEKELQKKTKIAGGCMYMQIVYRRKRK